MSFETGALLAPHALLEGGWAENVEIRWDDSGTVTSVTPRASGSNAPRAEGPVAVGMPNLHSHAFQRLIAARTQHPVAGADFWSWRDAMYQAVSRLSIDLVESATAWLFSELLAAGYTSVVEFHYLHRPGGALPLETAKAVIRAAERTGIRLTLAPVLYERSGFGEEDLAPGQRPFGMTRDEYLELVTGLRDDLSVAIAPHSLRAVAPEGVQDLAKRLTGIPLHVHIAEQMREVESCQEATGLRPIEWLLEHVPLDESWGLVHATQSTEGELRGMADAGAIVVLCPTTEFDLGDGRFPLERFSGSWGIGSDSQVAVSPGEELRLLLGSMRAAAGRRAVLPQGALADGTALWQLASSGKEAVTGHMQGKLQPGYAADFIVIDASRPEFESLPPDEMFTSWVLGGAPSQLARVVVAGRTVATQGVHLLRGELEPGWRAAMRSLAG